MSPSLLFQTSGSGSKDRAKRTTTSGVPRGRRPQRPQFMHKLHLFQTKVFMKSVAQEPLNAPFLIMVLHWDFQVGGRKTAQTKKNKFLGTEVPKNFSDQCSLDFAYFLCLFSGRRAKSSQELCSWELFFLILGGFSPSDQEGKRPIKAFGETAHLRRGKRPN